MTWKIDGYRLYELTDAERPPWRNFVLERTEKVRGRRKWRISFNGERFALDTARQHLERTRPKVAQWAFDVIASEVSGARR